MPQASGVVVNGWGYLRPTAISAAWPGRLCRFKGNDSSLAQLNALPEQHALEDVEPVRHEIMVPDEGIDVLRPHRQRQERVDLQLLVSGDQRSDIFLKIELKLKNRGNADFEVVLLQEEVIKGRFHRKLVDILVNAQLFQQTTLETQLDVDLSEGVLIGPGEPLVHGDVVEGATGIPYA